MQRPLGVTLFGSLNRLFFGFLGVLMSIGGMVFLATREQEMLHSAGVQSPLMLRIVLGWMLLVSSLLMTSGHWVLKLEERGRSTTVAVAVLMLFGQVLQNLTHPSRLLSLSAIGVAAYPVILIWYFTQPHIKEQFK